MTEASYSTGPVEPFLGGLDVHTFRFQNGLTLKVVPDRSAPVVAYQTWYGVGSADEKPGKTGLAHLFEHMMFKGTEGYSDGEYMKKLESMGADGLNAWTWMDQTVYVQAVPADRLDAVAYLESLRMRKLVVDEAAFKSELEVVINERRLSVDNDPDGRLNEALLSTAFDTHGYGWPTIGWMKDLEQLTREDAEAFYRRYYAPDNATILVVGDVVPDRAAEIVSAHYAGLPATGVRKDVRAAEPRQQASKRVELTLPMTADRVLIGFKVPSYTHADIPALLVLDAAITAGQSSRLRRALRDVGYVADVGSFVYPLRDPSLWLFQLQGRPGVSAEVMEKAFFTELDRIRREGVSEGELQLGIAQWRAHNWARLETALGKADFLGWTLTHTGSHVDGVRRIEQIAQVSLADVQRVASRWLDPQAATVAVGRAQERAPEVVVEDKGPVRPADRVVVSARAPRNDATVGRSEIREQTLEGATVVLTTDATLPLVSFRLYLTCGAALDPEGREGLAYLMGKAMLRGTKTRDRRAFEEAVEQLGASVSISVDSDGLTVGGTCLAETWPAYAALVGEALREPAFVQEHIDQLRLEIENELVAVLDDDGELCGTALRRALWPAGHPYAKDPRGTPPSLRALTPADLADFHRRFVRAEGALVGVAGALDSAVEDDIRVLLCGIAGKPERLPVFPPVQRAHKPKLVLVDKPERTQAQVAIGQLGLEQRRADFPGLVLFNDAFGVGFGGRLMKEVRVARGWTYFAYSYPVLADHACSFAMVLAPGEKNAADAVALVHSLAKASVEKGLDGEELEQVRAARMNGRPFLADTVKKRLDLDLRRRLLGYDRIAATERMATLTLEETNAAWASQVHPESFVTVVLATADHVRADLEAKVGPIDEVLSWTEFSPPS